MSEFDILIKNGRIVDGSGYPACKGSLGIVGTRIVEVGEICGSSANIVIDAENLIVTPGFVDPHSHFDYWILVCPTLEDYAVQGVTTAIGGNCGFSPAPAKDFYAAIGLPDVMADLRRPGMYQGICTQLSNIFPLDEFRVKVREVYGIDIDWHSFAEFLGRIEEEGISINFVPFVGHGAIRLAAMGLDYKRKATEAELEEMRGLVAEAMEAGAFGMSTGRDYPPQDYADADEVVELAKVAKNYGGFYFTHYGGLNANGLKEAAEIGRKTGVPVHISHLVSAFSVKSFKSTRDAVSPKVPETLLESAAYETLNVVDRYIKENIITSFDVILSPVGATDYLALSLRPWLEWAVSRKKLAECLKIQDFRKELKEAINTGKWLPLGWFCIRIVLCKNEGYVGRTVAEIAEEKNESELDTLLNIVIEDPDTRAEYSLRDETQIKTLINHPYAMPSTDKIIPIYGSWKRTNPSYMLPYEYSGDYSLLSTGGFALYIRRFVKELKVLTLEEAIRKATSLPAQTFNIRDRGILKEGAYADIVIFNYEEIEDIADRGEPLRASARARPKGLEYVIVNGKVIMEKNQHTGIRAGRTLRKNAQE